VCVCVSVQQLRTAGNDDVSVDKVRVNQGQVQGQTLVVAPRRRLVSDVRVVGNIRRPTTCSSRHV